jgi:hypothetical protein
LIFIIPRALPGFSVELIGVSELHAALVGAAQQESVTVAGIATRMSLIISDILLTGITLSFLAPLARKIFTRAAIRKACTKVVERGGIIFRQISR